LLLTTRLGASTITKSVPPRSNVLPESIRISFGACIAIVLIDIILKPRLLFISINVSGS
jgi:hypothetical protein